MEAPVTLVKAAGPNGKKAKLVTIAATRQQLDKFYGAEPPASLLQICLTSVQASVLHALARRALQTLAEAKVPHALAEGTLLGWARLQTLLPWDDDLDVCVPSERLRDLKAIDWRAKGLSFVRGDLAGLYKVYFTDRCPGDADLVACLNGRAISGSLKPWRWPFLDIFLMQKDSRTQRHYVGATKKLWPSVAMDADFSTMRAALSLAGASVQTYVPRSYARYLDASYGPDWRTTAVLPDFSHRHDRMVFRSPQCRAARYDVGGDWGLRKNGRWGRYYGGGVWAKGIGGAS